MVWGILYIASDLDQQKISWKLVSVLPTLMFVALQTRAAQIFQAKKNNSKPMQVNHISQHNSYGSVNRVPQIP